MVFAELFEYIFLYGMCTGVLLFIFLEVLIICIIYLIKFIKKKYNKKG